MLIVTKKVTNHGHFLQFKDYLFFHSIVSRCLIFTKDIILIIKKNESPNYFLVTLNKTCVDL